MRLTYIRPLSQSPFPSLLRPPVISSPQRLAILYPHRAYSSQISAPSFSYQISASFSAKQHALEPSKNFYHLDPANNSPSSVPQDIDSFSSLERKRKRWKSGQDAFFVSAIPESGSIAFGVVDGVGGWVDSGVDPADFSHRLCECMSKEAVSPSPKLPDQQSNATHGPRKTRPSTQSKSRARPLELLQKGYDLVMSDDSIGAGGSTACIGMATKNGVLEVANLGDSGYAHFSPLRLTNLSEPQTHAFNTPFQLSKIPQSMVRQMRLFGSEHFAELPADSDLYKHSVAHGDVFVFATDGVWDNLSPEDVLRIVSGIMLKSGAWEVGSQGAAAVGKSFKGSVSRAPDISAGESNSADSVTPANGQQNPNRAEDLSTVLAKAIVREAKECSLSRRRDSPFAKEVNKHYPFENWRGGKQDDICVVAGVATEDGQ